MFLSFLVISLIEIGGILTNTNNFAYFGHYTLQKIPAANNSVSFTNYFKFLVRIFGSFNFRNKRRNVSSLLYTYVLSSITSIHFSKP